MSLAEAKEQLSKVARARGGAGVSDEDNERLRNEFDMLMARVREGAR